MILKFKRDDGTLEFSYVQKVKTVDIHLKGFFSFDDVQKEKEAFDTYLYVDGKEVFDKVTKTFEAIKVTGLLEDLKPYIIYFNQKMYMMDQGKTIDKYTF